MIDREWPLMHRGSFSRRGDAIIMDATRVVGDFLHLVMTSAVAVIVASMFVLIFELERPFRVDLGVAATPWAAFLNHVRMMDVSGPRNMRM